MYPEPFKCVSRLTFAVHLYSWHLSLVVLVALLLYTPPS